jgi:hypothetical protein
MFFAQTIFTLLIYSFIYPQKFDKYYPIRNYNSIDSISVTDTSSKFFSKGGLIIYDKKEDLWRIDTCITKNKIPPEVKYYFYKGDKTPPYFLKYTGTDGMGLIDSIKVENDEFMLFYPYSTAGIVPTYFYDGRVKRIYELWSSNYKNIYINKDFIYLPNEYGFTKINEKNNNVIRYTILPTMNKHSSFHYCNNDIWIATDHVGIQQIHKDSSIVTFWDPFVISKEEIKDPIFTNFIQIKDNLIIGCGDFLFVYSIPQNQWNTIKMENIWGFENIFAHDDNVLLIHNYLDLEDGNNQGALYYYDFAKKSLTAYPDINIDDIIVGIEKDNSNTVISSIVPFGDDIHLEKYYLGNANNSLRRISSEKIEREQLDKIESHFYEPMKLNEYPGSYETNMNNVSKLSIKPLAIIKKIKLRECEDNEIVNIKEYSEFDSPSF